MVRVIKAQYQFIIVEGIALLGLEQSSRSVPECVRRRRKACHFPPWKRAETTSARVSSVTHISLTTCLLWILRSSSSFTMLSLLFLSRLPLRYLILKQPPLTGKPRGLFGGDPKIGDLSLFFSICLDATRRSFIAYTRTLVG